MSRILALGWRADLVADTGNGKRPIIPLTLTVAVVRGDGSPPCDVGLGPERVAIGPSFGAIGLALVGLSPELGGIGHGLVGLGHDRVGLGHDRVGLGPFGS
ncbi:MAG: hypothetical protein GY767_17840 [Shimia sp.]|nr:hypothetical protein [Shimia sp.]